MAQSDTAPATPPILTVVEGRAVVLEGEERLKALAAYLDKFPDVRRLFERPRDDNEKLIAGRLQRAPFWRLTPGWIRLIDSTRGFGWKWETTLPLQGRV